MKNQLMTKEISKNLDQKVGLTVLLLGSTGYIGQFVKRELISRGYKVVCPVRTLSLGNNFENGKSGNFELNLSDSKAVKQFREICPPINFIVSCIASRTGGVKDSWEVEYKANLNILNLTKNLDIKLFVLLSAICVQKPMLAFQKAKIAFENDLICSGIPYSIIRPTAFFKSLSGQVERVKQGKKFIIFDSGERTACKPISEADLSNFICDSLVLPERKNRILPIGGPGPSVTPRDQGNLLFSLLGIKPRFQSIPSSSFSLFRAVLSPLGPVSSRISDLREFAAIGRYYATESMLVWDSKAGEYNSTLTPEFGSHTLKEFYENVLSQGIKGQELGSHKLF